MPRHRITAALAVAGAVAGASLLVPAVAGARTVSCQGSEVSCIATVSLAGGASNEKLVVNLPGTNLKRWGTAVTPITVEGAYSLSRGQYSLGGSVYTTTLNAVQSIPKGAKLQLTFVDKAIKSEGTLTCKSTVKAADRLKVTAVGNDQAKGAFSCKQANQVSAAYLKVTWSAAVKNVTVGKIAYSCKRVSGPRNTLCYGGSTTVAFDTQTG